jgi:hypothetical protein
MCAAEDAADGSEAAGTAALGDEDDMIKDGESRVMRMCAMEPRLDSTHSIDTGVKVFVLRTTREADLLPEIKTATTTAA